MRVSMIPFDEYLSWSQKKESNSDMEWSERLVFEIIFDEGEEGFTALN